MGGGSIAMSAAREIFSSSPNTGTETPLGVEWAKCVGRGLTEGPEGDWVRVSLKQLGGMLICVFVRRKLSPYVASVESVATGCGVLGVGANKGKKKEK